jgi:hypothetical protein
VKLLLGLQVVSEASDAAAKGILHHCHAPRLVLQVCDILTGDKSAKLRKHCSGLLLQVRPYSAQAAAALVLYDPDSL